ncbi:hypothetical protein [Colwellia sp. BRX10-4]|jgi:hypothetical protein|uniref:hypothetical protein n=1 Tax=Colwellia sp. BRX10-4 TaxID=2759843 RepID=UPI0017DC3D8E|nr:hypothetical protein [Colwellia sp. BRX10-4]MBA6399844.1 hypothetical protein [Colwellia sp. BRX10-4]
MEVLCKWHVIVKYILNHDSKEKFFPIMTCAFWLNIVIQSLLYITYINPNSVSLSSELPKILILAFFFFTIVLFYFAVKNDLRYQRAEAWFTSLSINTSRKIKVIVGTSMLLSFFVLMVWAISLM